MQIDSITDTLIGSSFSNNPQNNLSIVNKKVSTSGLESEMALANSNVLVDESGRPGKRPKITDDKVRK